MPLHPHVQTTSRSHGSTARHLGSCLLPIGKCGRRPTARHSHLNALLQHLPASSHSISLKQETIIVRAAFWEQALSRSRSMA